MHKGDASGLGVKFPWWCFFSGQGRAQDTSSPEYALTRTCGLSTHSLWGGCAEMDISKDLYHLAEGSAVLIREGYLF